MLDDRLGLVIVEGPSSTSPLPHTSTPPTSPSSAWRAAGAGPGRAPTRRLSALDSAIRAQVYLALDADRRSNRDVWDAAHNLAEHLRLEFGASEVRFVTLPGAGTDGMDDFLARQNDPREVLRKLLDGADSKEGRASSTSCPQLLRRARQLLALDLVNFIDEGWPLALTQELSIAVYRDGRYWNGESKKFNSITLDLLGNDFTPLRLATAESAAIALCSGNDARIPENLDEPLVNCLNGLLDLRTLELRPH